MEHLKSYNGMEISKSERADAERLYVQYAYKEYLNQMNVTDKI